MPEKQQEIKIINQPIGGLDSDSESRVVAPTDYRYALNIYNGISYVAKYGSATNLLGNTRVDYSLPPGVNKCIGAKDDNQSKSVVFFIWNSKGAHQIVRYYPGVTDSLRPNGTILLEYEFNFGWAKDEYITGINIINGTLLYWVDSVKPRKINMATASYYVEYGSDLYNQGQSIGVLKPKTWDFTLPANTKQLIIDGVLHSSMSVSFRNMNSAIVHNTTVSWSGITERGPLLKAIGDALNADNTCPVRAVICSNELDITEKIAGSVSTIEIQTQPSIAIPTNWYGLNPIDRISDACKFPSTYPPAAEYKIDTDVEFNFMLRHNFQFSLQLVYDDKEESSLSPTSNLPDNNLLMGIVDEAYNFIRVGFNNPDLFSLKVLPILKYIKILVKVRNTGNLRIVEVLSPYEFINYENNAFVCYYDFYNKEATTAISADLEAKPFDFVPKLAAAQEFVNERLVYANTVDDEDKVDCLDVEVTQTFDTGEQLARHKIKGQVLIFNSFLDGSTYGSSLAQRGVAPNFLQARGPVLYNGSLGAPYPFPYYGGVYIHGTGAHVLDAAYILYDQRMPLGGFYMYLTGTNFATVAKQKAQSGLSQRGDGSIDITADKQTVYSFYQNPGNRVNLCEFEFDGVPDGDYVIRMASPWVSYGDLLKKGTRYDLNNGLEYQTTSAPIWGVQDFTSGSFVWKEQAEITVTIRGGDVFVGQFVVADLCYPNSALFAENKPEETAGVAAVAGYLMDASDGVNSDQSQQALALKGVRCELTTMYRGLFPEYQDPASLNTIRIVTDHNGYFFLPYTEITYNINAKNVYFSDPTDIPFGSEQIIAPVGTPLTIRKPLDVNGNTQWFYKANVRSALQDLSDGVLLTTTLISEGLNELILPTTVAQARTTSSTLIQGAVVDQNGNPVPNVLVVYQRGRWVYTGTNGKFEILAWGDMSEAYVGPPPGFVDTQYNRRINDRIVLNLIGVSFVGSTQVQLVINPFSPPAVYQAGNLSFAVTNLGTFLTRLKRGGSYNLGLQYYDAANRSGSVLIDSRFNIYIPGVTEDLGKYLPNYPLGTYLHGVPFVSVRIKHAAPSWAKTFQLVRTKNQIQSKILDWRANQVKYIISYSYDNTVDPPKFQSVDTTYANGDATHVMIDLSNISAYYQNNNASQIAYSFEDGDRIRFIKDRDEVYYEGLYDKQVLSYQNSQWLIFKFESGDKEIKSGVAFEVYSIKKTTDEKLFYEMSECFPVVNGTHGPQPIEILGGDTYWRPRNIPVVDTANAFIQNYFDFIEDPSISDFYPSRDENIGRVAVYNANFRRIHRPTNRRVSGVFIPDSGVNGLSEFTGFDDVELSREYGDIARLFYIGYSLINICANRIAENYIQKTLVIDEQQQELLSVGAQFLGAEKPLTGIYGTIHPASCYKWDKMIYGYDGYRGCVWGYDHNVAMQMYQKGTAVGEISSAKMSVYFIDTVIRGVVSAVGGFDPYRYMYDLTLTFQSGESETIGWDEAKKRWVSFYSFVPEVYAATLNSSVISFKNGGLWFHDDPNAPRNNFYGVQYNTKYNFISNGNPDENKRWKRIYMEADQANGKFDWQIPVITNHKNQLSRLQKVSFVKKEEFYFSEIKMNLSSPGFTNPILNGAPLRSSSIEFQCENDSISEITLRSVVVGYNLSPRI